MGFWDEKSTGKSLAMPRCADTHPRMKMGKGVLCGGNASFPVVEADVYVVLQSGSTCGRASDPWAEQKVVEIHYWLVDRSIPRDLPRFKKMIDWLCNQLHEGKTVHVGCIGGHGRTGLVLSAIVKQMLDEKDAIQYVRKHYCDRAVESTTQVEFLMKHYGVSKVESSKEDGITLYSPSKSGKQLNLAYSSAVPFEEWGKPKMLEEGKSLPSRKLVPAAATKETKTFVPMASSRCIWGKCGNK